jgi:hypothetical protein
MLQVRHVFLPDLQYERLEHSQEVLVPVMALYDDPAHDPLDDNTPTHRRVMLDDINDALDVCLSVQGLGLAGFRV